MGYDFGKNNLHHIINTKLGDLVEWFPTKISDKKEGKKQGIFILGGVVILLYFFLSSLQIWRIVPVHHHGW